MEGPLTQERAEPEVAHPDPDGESPRARRGPVRAVIKALRPQEWVKNTLVFAGLLFSAKFKEFDAIVAASVTFAAFCMVASAGYLVNDAHDIAEDRQHPTKRFRPIAAGELAIPTAITLAIVLAVVALAGSTLLEGWEVGVLVLAYGVGTTLYSYVLKHEVILDVMTISGLFVLRVLAGAVAVGADASAFLLLCTGMVALFLGVPHPRPEATPPPHSGPPSTPALEHYPI